MDQPPRRDGKEVRYSRYSIAKFKDYTEYSERASSSRIALVLLLTPATALLTSLIPPLVHLRDPNDGLQKNWSGFLLHVTATAWLTLFGGSLQFRACACIPHEDYSTVQVALAATVATPAIVGFAALMSYFWRFPVPFYWVFVSAPWVISGTLGNVLASRGDLLRKEVLRRKVFAYYPAFVVQISQIIVYPAFSALYEAATEWQKVTLTLLFPALKYSFKRIVCALSWHKNDFSEEARVAGVEICASVYQSMIMQTTPSAIATAVVIGVDVVQGFLSIKLMMEKRSVIPQADILSTAQAHIHLCDPEEKFLSDVGTKKLQIVTTISRNILSSPRLKPTMIAPMASALPKKRRSTLSRKDATVMAHALEILQCAENLLLVEYIEVVIPAINGIFLFFAAQMRTAIFNEKLYIFYYHREHLDSALVTLTLYTLLQLLSVMVMVAIMRLRFRLSPVILLAFHLERHAWSLQGKMVAWLAGLLHFGVIHYGADFSFRFHFKVPTADD